MTLSEIFKNTFSYRAPPVTSSEFEKYMQVKHYGYTYLGMLYHA